MDSGYSYNYTVDSTNAAAAGGAAFAGIMVFVGIIWLISMAVAIVSIIAMWKLFAKAGKPGWAAIVPIYNIIVWCEIVGRPLWWILLMFVPLVQIFVILALSIDLAKSFGKDITFGVLLFFFQPIMLLLLAFGKDTHYVGPVALGTDMFSSFSNHPQPAPAAPGAPVTPTSPAVPPAPVQTTPSAVDGDNKTI
jgi:hypothetical protein